MHYCKLIHTLAHLPYCVHSHTCGSFSVHGQTEQICSLCSLYVVFLYAFLYTTNDSFTVHMIIQFPGLISHIHFSVLLILLLTFDVSIINQVRGSVYYFRFNSSIVYFSRRIINNGFRNCIRPWLFVRQILVWPWYFIPIFQLESRNQHFSFRLALMGIIFWMISL